jgi:hypothetical protein
MNGKSYIPKSMKNLTSYFLIGVILITITSCNTSKQNQSEAFTIAEQKNDKTEKQDSLREKYSISSTFSRTHPDSIKKWDEQYFKEREAYKIKPSIETKLFKIDSISGKVLGCPYLNLSGQISKTENNNYSDSINLIFKKEKKIYTDLIRKNCNDCFIYEEDSIVKGIIGHIFNKNNKNIFIFFGGIYGGSLERIFLFSEGKEIVKDIKLAKHLHSPNFQLSKEGNFLLLSDSGVGDFYIFYDNGAIYQKGNFNNITKNNGTSYNLPYISEYGKYYVLNNNFSYLYKDNELIRVFTNKIANIDEKTGIIHLYEVKSISSRTYNHYFYNMNTDRLEYYSENLTYPKNMIYEYPKF